ncbi:dihydroorotase [Desulfogranum japonicum]|uniref:dihydroorotase n=1 Tax=Desulfogranum japonicum TaxID=231447 RepID=UPI0003FAEAB8|nr:dihydroorotase [Desulfogranum japonicum]
MNTSWIIKQGRVIDPVNAVDQCQDIYVLNGKITDDAASLPADVQIIDAKGQIVVPGLIDMHVHLREPGQEYKEDILSGTRSAVHGGFTAVACMPNTSPVNDSASVCRFILDKAREAPARVYPVCAISKGSNGHELTEMGDLRENGAVAVSDDGVPVTDSQLMRRALEYASDFQLTVISHCEDPALSTGVMNEGSTSTLLGLKGIPVAAESVMVYRDIALAEFTGKPVHIAHVSCAQSLELIRAAKQRGVRVTAETAPHYFSLTDDAVTGYDTNAKMNPPLRQQADVDAVRSALCDGTIDVIATDHAPHSILEKELEFDAAANGIIGLETALPLTLRLVQENVLDFSRMVELMSVWPAKILGVQGGHLSPGARADITIIDPEDVFTYTEEMIVSKSKNSPFIGQQFKGRAVLTMVDGIVQFGVAENNTHPKIA